MIEIGLAAVIGAILHGLGAWLDSHEPFSPRLFLKTLITAVIAGAVFTAGYSLIGDAPEMKDFIIAFLAGAMGNATRDYIRGTVSK